MASLMHEILTDGEIYPEEARRVKTLLRSLSVLDEWLDKNEGRTLDEVRLRRMKGLRGEALEQLRLSLNLARR